jgi:thiamine-monophosphate kinase
METRGKTLAEAGELAFIDRIRPLMPQDGGEIVRSVGDDCLVAGPYGDNHLLATTDTFVDTVHFSRSIMTFFETGRRCMTASVSDIAAMGGMPSFSLVSLSMPGDMLLDDAAALFEGLSQTAAEYGCPVAGGETTSTPGPATITVTVMGTVGQGKAITRSGAKPGDGIWVSGTLGEAMAGLEILLKGEKDGEALTGKFINPKARVGLAQTLTRDYTITSMIDISDGVATDLGHICDESACGARITSETVPMSEAFLDFAASRGIDPVAFALSSGEEFELLFTSGDRNLPDTTVIDGVTITRIGDVTKNPGSILLETKGNVTVLPRSGYEHFRR